VPAREAGAGEGGRSGEAMPSWIPRLLLLIAASVVGLWIAHGIVSRIRDFLVWLLIALFLSFALEPGVDWLARHGWKRGLVTGLALALVALLAAGLVAAIAPVFFRQVEGIVSNLPSWLAKVNTYTVKWLHVDVTSQKVINSLQSLRGSIVSYAGNLAGNMFGIGARLFGVVAGMATVTLFTFYLVADGPRFRRGLLSLMRPERQRDILQAWEIAIEKTGGYFYSRLVIAIISSLATLIALEVLRVPFALPLALWMGVISAFLPVVGTYIGAALPVLIAFLHSVLQGIIVLAFLVLFQQLLDYLVAPRVSQRTMALHPAVAIGAVIVGASLLGPVGAFLALPVAATLQASISTYLHRYEVVESDLTRRGGGEGGEPTESA
jgi:predicted PurR-regulated permease PerM